MESNELEFKVFGKSIEFFSICYGLFLIIWGIIVSFFSESTSMTSYIPSYLGLLIALFSILSIKFPNKKKAFMHIVVLVGVVTMLGGLDLIRGIFNETLFLNFWADLSKLMMLMTGIYFIYICVQSFRFARKNREISN